jgi:Uma2 family endonuclease
MNVVLPTRMTVDEFLAWAVRQEKGKYELFDGRVVMQQPQTWGHADIAWRVANHLAAVIERSGIPYYAAPMGMTVRISEHVAFEPDALVAPLPKLAGYFQVASIEHYVVLDPEDREIIWHRRAAGGGLDPPVTLREGSLRLDPPGIALAVADIFVSA